MSPEQWREFWGDEMDARNRAATGTLISGMVIAGIGTVLLLDRFGIVDAAILWRLWPMLFAVGFIGLFMIGGLSGVMLALYPWDQYVTDSYFVVAHFHYVLGTVPVFAVIAGVHFWFPKMTGRMLDRTLALWSFWLLFVGFNMTFFPMHAMGLSGMPRRVSSYSNPDWTVYNQIATLGSLIIAVGVLVVLWNVLSSLRGGRLAGSDPWGANSLEWYTTSPPPPHNFDHLPPILSERPVYDARKAAIESAGRAAAPAAAGH